ncbi:MAG: helicase HerA-like domain-containing protein [Alphaproteobacteria bacterium]|nr:helicase HerA-like domain-containing protein [Alphaproteobacteria bacterium]
MADGGSIFLGKGEAPQSLKLSVANRHGLIAGATGTGKTATLRVLAEGFSRAGVPVFVADIKGDLAGLCQPADVKPFITERLEKIGMTDWKPTAHPVVFWDLFGELGHQLRATVSEMGPTLLSRMLGLNDTQEGVLNIVFRIADEQGLLLLDLKDLRAMLVNVGENAAQHTMKFGNIAPASIGAIQRALLTLENQGADAFFGEPALKLSDLIFTDEQGRGAIHVLAAEKLFGSPQLYATFLLWLLSELYEQMTEVGDLDKPRFVFFFDEAHLLFDDTPKALVDKVEQVVRLIRSKGVGVYFITQSPLDVPDDVLGQLGNKVQHALRAFTPKDRKSVKAVADNFRENPKFAASDAVQELAVGEALVSTLDAKGIPSIVDRVLIAPPSCRMGPITPDERAAVMAVSPLKGVYDETIDRESAYEILVGRAEGKNSGTAPSTTSGPEPARRTWGSGDKAGPRTPQAPRPAPQPRSSGGGYQRQTMGEAAAKSAVRSIGSSLGRALVRGVLGSLLKR